MYAQMFVLFHTDISRCNYRGYGLYMAI